jgi:hypothetical protein
MKNKWQPLLSRPIRGSLVNTSVFDQLNVCGLAVAEGIAAGPFNALETPW